MKFSVRRITKLKELTGARSYLEVGVSEGRTFNALSFKRKVAVDPCFRFDTRQFSSDSVLFFSQTSDEYFRQNAHGERFDIIFLDGLHTYDQTFKDLASALMHSHERTVFIVDDVQPIDSYSSMRRQDFAYYSRRIETVGGLDSSLAGHQWHGDVYRIIPLIRLFMPKLEYSTIIGSGNPQLVIWNDSAFMQAEAYAKKPFVPFRDSRLLRLIVESLDRLDYNYFMNNISDVIQESQEDQLFDYLCRIYAA